MTYNIYYSPEAFGLKTVLDVDKSDGCYQFDQFVIWEASDGSFYWAGDSGCSCPAPFENHNLLNISRGTVRDAINDARVWVDCESYYEQGVAAARSRIEDFASKYGE